MICEAPKLGPHRDAMRARARRRRSALAPLEVNVKFTTNEGMGFVGRGEGIAALAVATVRAVDATQRRSSAPWTPIELAFAGLARRPSWSAPARSPRASWSSSTWSGSSGSTRS